MSLSGSWRSVGRASLSRRLQQPLLQLCRRELNVDHQRVYTVTKIEPVVPWKTSTSVWTPETLIPPPKEDQILFERRPDRALPPIPPRIPRQVRNTFPFFVLAMAISIAGFFNYQKVESSVVSSTLYALRTNPAVRTELGDEIYFASKYPRIKGTINQLHGKIDISFWVKGTKAQGEVKLRCRRRKRGGLYSTEEYSLEVEDAPGEKRKMELYDPKGNAMDPFQLLAGRRGDY